MLRISATCRAKNCAYCLLVTGGRLDLLRSSRHRGDFTQDVKQRVYSHSLLGKRAPSVHLTLVRRATLAKPLGHRINRRTPMKKLIIAVALVVASASAVLAEGFPNVYMTR